MNQKLCVRCNIRKPLGEFYNNKRMVDGKHSYCKDCCINFYNTEEPTVTKKTCPRCKQTKPATAFNRNKRTKSGLTVNCSNCEKRRYRNEAP